MSTLSTHVLDAVTGRPADGVRVWLERLDRVPAPGDDPGATLAAEGTTDTDGRIGAIGGPGSDLVPGIYRLSFGTGGYFARSGTPSFYPLVSVTFTVSGQDRHQHVPVLLSPYAFSTYRGR